VYITSMPHAEQSGQIEYDQDSHRYLLVNKDFGGADAGGVSVLAVPPGASQVVRAGSFEAGSILVSGSGELVGTGPVTAGRVFQSGPGDSFTLRAGQLGATLLTVQGQPLGTEDASRGGRNLAVDDVADSPAHNPALGFHHMSARMLIDVDNGGSRSFTLGMGTFAPGEGCHALHRHAHAEEIFYVWEGAGVHLTGDGARHPLAAGELAFVPRNEWHGFQNTSDSPVRAFFGYLGVGARADAGYEVMEGACLLPT
jgi:quercetin dioxygenase-like cupin family protein